MPLDLPPARGNDGGAPGLQAQILESLHELRVLGRQQIIAFNDERNQFAALEREHAKTRNIVEQLLGEALANLHDMRAESARTAEQVRKADTLLKSWWVRLGRILRLVRR